MQLHPTAHPNCWCAPRGAHHPPACYKLAAPCIRPCSHPPFLLFQGKGLGFFLNIGSQHPLIAVPANSDPSPVLQHLPFYLVPGSFLADFVRCSYFSLQASKCQAYLACFCPWVWPSYASALPRHLSADSFPWCPTVANLLLRLAPIHTQEMNLRKDVQDSRHLQTVALLPLPLTKVFPHLHICLLYWDCRAEILSLFSEGIVTSAEPCRLRCNTDLYLFSFN